MQQKLHDWLKASVLFIVSCWDLRDITKTVVCMVEKLL